MDNFWIIPIVALVMVGIMLVASADVRMNTPERYIEPEVIIPKKVSEKSPYVEFCDPKTEFAPDKLIQNNTHKFNHDTCIWDKK